jgi:hypothetical protein
MKRLIALLALAILSVPALADSGKPYEQLDVDRALPNLDMAAERSLVAAGGNTRSDVEISVADGESPWAKDHNFIAPAQ